MTKNKKKKKKLVVGGLYSGVDGLSVYLGENTWGLVNGILPTGTIGRGGSSGMKFERMMKTAERKNWNRIVAQYGGKKSWQLK